MVKQFIKPLIAIVALTIVAFGFILTSKSPSTQPASNTIDVIAGENFWGSLVAQIGGSHVHVTSIVSDPNADPHEYETSATDARAFATAQYIVLNGGGYDTWGAKLISGNQNKSRLVLTIATLLGKSNRDNPHFWYNPNFINQVTARIKLDLSTIDPADSTYFDQQYKLVQTSLAVYQGQIASIKRQYADTKVAATEDIFSYLADATGLDLISPTSFIQAVAEGNDPPATSVVEFQQQLQQGQVKLLVYNKQTVTPLTNTIQKLAIDHNIPIVGITETIQPPAMSFQDWMNGELTDLDNALQAKASR